MNTRKYSRTMQEAFGPYTNNVLEPMPEADTVTDVAIVLASVAAVAVAGAREACAKTCDQIALLAFSDKTPYRNFASAIRARSGT